MVVLPPISILSAALPHPNNTPPTTTEHIARQAIPFMPKGYPTSPLLDMIYATLMEAQKYTLTFKPCDTVTNPATQHGMFYYAQRNL